MGEVFDAAFVRRFEEFEEVETGSQALDVDVESSRGKAFIESDVADWGIEQAEAVRKLCQEINLTPDKPPREIVDQSIRGG